MPRRAAPSVRPPFIVSAADVDETTHSYPGSDEPMAPSRAIGRAAGLVRLGLHLTRLPPGHRISYPHAESNEEEFVYVITGQVEAWIDGELHHMSDGDLVAFPAGTGICHTVINDGAYEALLLVGGEATKRDNKIFYPLNPEREAQVRWSEWWADVPLGPQGPHDGKPAARRRGRPITKTPPLRTK